MRLTEFEEIFSIKLPNSWQPFFQQELEKSYFPALLDKVLQQYQTKIIYPPVHQIWRSFTLTPFDRIRGVLLGQDPYHKAHQSCGLPFSIAQDQKITPSLRNIFKELQRSHGKTIPTHGCLDNWAKQGLFSVNTILTVEEGKPLSHARLGWQDFTDQLIIYISIQKEPVFFFLWGREAQKKASLIDADRHGLIYAPHPSPLSRQSFVGCNCFTQADSFLKKQGQTPLIW